MAGHFPGAPIVPGALLLVRVQEVIQACVPEESYVLRSAKFLRPVKPGELLHLTWQRGTNSDLTFTCGAQDEPALVGVFTNIKAPGG